MYIHMLLKRAVRARAQWASQSFQWSIKAGRTGEKYCAHGCVCAQHWQRSHLNIAHSSPCLQIQQRQLLHYDQPQNLPPAVRMQVLEPSYSPFHRSSHQSLEPCHCTIHRLRLTKYDAKLVQSHCQPLYLPDKNIILSCLCSTHHLAHMTVQSS